ncbi:restriction endonuclease subunit S [Flavobacterium cerinum]|uniref:Restriction endonuclease subunit S n=1 Tax=Flavobacterium cerinum TaxID=2502784 RepID=A0ABY5IVT1_9FLAO|nr:restriction endonuclease subunit S [Flavobacterium cerinum]UUC46769.1 restriction endonuclease subunit S [Flavobacterium cerinum]
MKEQQEKYNLPEGWINVSLGDILILEYGKSLPKNSRQDGKYPIFGSNGIIGYHNDFLVKGPVIIIGRKGSVGSVHISNENCWPIDTTYYIKPAPSLNFKFIFFILKFLNLSKLDKSTTIPGLNRDNVYEQIIELPSLNEQNRITLKLEELFSSLEKSQQQLRATIDQIDAYKQLVLQNAFLGTNSSFVKKLEEILVFIGSGITPKGGKKVYKDSGIIFIRSQNVHRNKLDINDAAYITLSTHEKMKRTHVKPFDVLLNITGASIGRCAFVPESFKEANVNQHVCILRPDPQKVYYKYLSLYLNSPKAQDIIMSVQTGATRQGLNYSQIRELPIPLPNISTQKDIVKYIEQKISICDKLYESVTSSLLKADNLRQSMLVKSFKGKLVDNDLNSENLKLYIERIQKEKETYVNQLKEEKNSTPKIKAMPDTPKNILQILNERKESVSASELWSLSDKKDDIDGFYAELKKNIDEGLVIEEKPRKGKVAFLKLADKK